MQNGKSYTVISEIIDGRLVPGRSLIEILGVSGCFLPGADKTRLPRIAAVGAGGKTTVLKLLAEEYQVSGIGAVLTTTTHMWKEEGEHFLENPSFEQIAERLEKSRYVLTGSGADRGKIGGLSKEMMEKIFGLACPVLIEADGARRLPMKIPAEHEPVLPPQTTCVLSVYGLQAVGKKLTEVCFRPELAAEFLGKPPDSLVKPEDLAALAASTCGGRKGLESYMEYVLILSQADTEERRAYALEVWKAVNDRQNVKTIVISAK